MNSAINFKPQSKKLTEYRIKLVMKYITHCYFQMISDKKTYDFSMRGKIQKEDFLRNGLVDDYLSKKQNKEFYKNYISDNPNVDIYFQKEENQIYQLNGVLSDDYIDISIKETKLSESLSGDTSDEIKFAIECKRIKASKDYIEYVKDIQKFSERPFTTYRLPYEGQIAFIEKPNFTYSQILTNLNKKLEDNTSINTIQYLNSSTFHEDFDGGYRSIHTRNHTDKAPFSIFHLLFDYSTLVTDSKIKRMKRKLTQAS